RWLHGEAVAIGTVMAARTSAALGWLADGDCERIESLFVRAGLPVRAAGIDPAAVLDRMQLDKKAGRGGVRVVLLRAIGDAELVPAPGTDLLLDAVARCIDG